MSWRRTIVRRIASLASPAPARLALQPALVQGRVEVPIKSVAAAGLACLALSVVPRGSNNPVAMATQDELKKQVGYKAVDDYVKSNMVVGLGTGSTAYFAVERVGQKLKSGELTNIVAVPTSKRTKEQAESLGIPLATLDTHPALDVAIDGADAVDPELDLIKGGGGAHFREKIVEAASKTFIVIVDDTKMCDGLGPSFPLPVEIVPFCHHYTLRKLEGLPAFKGAGCKAVLRLGSSANNKVDGTEPAVTDNGNYVVDLTFEKPIKSASKAAEELKNTIGVVEHGLFIGMADAVVIAGADGISVQNRKRQKLCRC